MKYCHHGKRWISAERDLASPATSKNRLPSPHMHTQPYSPHLDAIGAGCFHDDLLQVGGRGKRSQLCQSAELNTLIHLGDLYARREKGGKEYYNVSKSTFLRDATIKNKSAHVGRISDSRKRAWF